MAKKKATTAKKSSGTVVIDRRTKKERRSGTDRRKEAQPVAVERRKGERRKVQRRRQIDPTTCERDYTPEEIEFMRALEAYKRRSGRMFPTCSEILEVLRDLGYEKREPGASDGAASNIADNANTGATDDISAGSADEAIAEDGLPEM